MPKIWDFPVELPKELNSIYFDPYSNRNVIKPNSYWVTFIHLIKGIFGTSILLMPYAFRLSGYMAGIAGTVVLISICTYCLHSLLESRYIICKRTKQSFLTYQRTLKYALEDGPPFAQNLSKYAETILDLIILMVQIAVCCMYVHYIIDNVLPILRSYNCDLKFKDILLYSFVPHLVIGCINSFKALSPISVASNIFALTAIVYFFLCWAFDLFKVTSFEHLSAFGRLIDIPEFVQIVISAIPVGVICPLQDAMQDPRDFTKRFGILNVTIILTIHLYTVFGLVSYLAYGNDVNILTLNLSNDLYLVIEMRFLYALSVFGTFAIQCLIGSQLICTKFEASVKGHKSYEMAIQIGFVVATFAFVLTIPDIFIFITIIGSIGLPLIIIVIPALIRICVLWRDRRSKLGEWKRHLILNVSLIIFGFFIIFLGTFKQMFKQLEY